MDNLLKLSGDFIARQSAVRIIFAIIALQFVMHIPFFSSPPVSQHTWRQVISLATAKNFYEEDARLLACMGLSVNLFKLRNWLIRYGKFKGIEFRVQSSEYKV